jgi:ribonucleotide reductase beta subunit family protein with ferritin-like domain
MRFNELKIDEKVIKNQKIITNILKEEGFNWLVDSEIESAKIKIEKGVIIWESGEFYSGFWKFGVFKGGTFFGVWENGIFEGGNFRGEWISGIKSK